MNDWRIGTKLGVSFAVVLLLMLFAFTVTLVSLKEVSRSAEMVEEESLPFLIVAYEMTADIIELQQWLTDVSATHNPDGFGSADAAARRFKAGVSKFRAMFREENKAGLLRQLWLDPINEAGA